MVNTHGPTVISARHWAEWRQWKTVERQWSDGTWGPARPLSAPTVFERFRIAWRVFTGEYDALSWSNYDRQETDVYKPVERLQEDLHRIIAERDQALAREERLQEALEFIAQERDYTTDSGIKFPGPAHDDREMWQRAVDALTSTY
jgi:hypothetical protein